jgi:hypothetical protein
MKEYVGFFLLCLMPFINWVIAGWAIGRYCASHFGWHYAIGVLIWAGINIAITVIGHIVITRQA